MSATAKGKSGLHFGFTPQSPYRVIAESQRKYLRQAAGRIERGESLDGLDGDLIAAVLRAFADTIPDKEPKPKGHPPKLDPGGLALHYLMYVHAKQMSKTEAIAKLAQVADVSIEAVKSALGKRRSLVAALEGLFTRKT